MLVPMIFIEDMFLNKFNLVSQFRCLLLTLAILAA